jgi:hypothetical protein
MLFLNPGEMESPGKEYNFIKPEFIAGLAMYHGTSGSQRQCHLFSNKKEEYIR